MDYGRVYARLIQFRRVNSPEEAIEIHHIIPKCVGGTDIQSNLIKLTKREHRFVHLLLPKIYKDSQGLKVAANLFCKKRLRYPPWNKNAPMSESQKVKIRASRLEKSLSDAHRLAIKASATRKTKVLVFNDQCRYEFESVKDAARFLKVPHQNVFRVLRKIRKSLKGYNIVHG